MGLFDGGFDMDALTNMLNPMGSAQAGQMPPNFDERFGAAFNPNAPPSPTNVPPGMISPTLNPTLMAEPNPSAVAPGQVPLPRPNPLQPSPEELAGATRLGLPGPEGNPLARSSGVTPGGVGAALRGETVPGAEGPTSVGGRSLTPPAVTDMSAQSKTGEAQRPSLAQALKGVQAPKPPELQKISSPNAPRPTGTIKGGDLQALLMALNAGVPALSGRQLPVTLGRG